MVETVCKQRTGASVLLHPFLQWLACSCILCGNIPASAVPGLLGIPSTHPHGLPRIHAEAEAEAVVAVAPAPPPSYARREEAYGYGCYQEPQGSGATLWLVVQDGVSKVQIGDAPASFAALSVAAPRVTHQQACTTHRSAICLPAPARLSSAATMCLHCDGQAASRQEGQEQSSRHPQSGLCETHPTPRQTPSREQAHKTREAGRRALKNPFLSACFSLYLHEQYPP